MILSFRCMSRFPPFEFHAIGSAVLCWYQRSTHRGPPLRATVRVAGAPLEGARKLLVATTEYMAGAPLPSVPLGGGQPDPWPTVAPFGGTPFLLPT